ncbi:hypothetical protein [Actinomadura rubrisoli]|uniref:Uncharacterized protein n=1 Tax=Actinomadura rubrisoli TaxID=2530368 RepID=A0A4R5BS17_9ACTN|nr:hypothetical protein [Actinomadura rubrisoli]TDD88356.1 hypothetical protein E1298_15210 [Actinomadura rubrisoli]
MIGWMFTQSCQVEPFTGEGAHGALYGPPVMVRCRVQEADTYQRGRDGSADRHEVDPATTVYLPFNTDCPARSRVTLPSGAAGTAMEVHRHAVPARLRHLRVRVQ